MFSISLGAAVPFYTLSRWKNRDARFNRVYIQSGVVFGRGLFPTKCRTFVPKLDGSGHPDSSIGIKRTAGLI